MTPLRRRLAALTCATVTAAVPLGGLTAAPSTATSLASSQSSQTSQSSAAATLAQLRDTHPGLDRLLAGPTGIQRAIVSFRTIPTTSQVRALQALGLHVQPMKRLPLALVFGPRPAIVAGLTSGIGLDVYPDEQLTYLDTASSNVMSSSVGAARSLRTKGLTGKGVTVGVIDSGCDATHPDLADHVVHNVTLVSPEYGNLGTDPTIVVPMEQGPLKNTDLGSGHGTHVAGIIAADGTTGPDHLGVAPDAELACFAIGAVITTTAVVTAFDYILDQPDHLSIDVINNSWGNSFRQFDPADPVNVATKAISKKGIVTVFAAGNSGSELGEASVSPFNQAPWVISVAASDLKRVRGGFSSNGLEFDNGWEKPIGADGHTVLTGTRIGNTQPDISAPGVDISSTCDSTGTVIGPCAPGENASASGTSMASPHIAGAAAVLKQANPRLSYEQVRRAMTSTATPMKDETKKAEPRWRVGYGHVNLDKAVALVRSQGWAGKIEAAQKKADRRLLAEGTWTVTRSALWQEAAPPVSAGGTFSRTYTVQVTPAARALKLTLVYPTPGTAANLAVVSATVKDARGTLLGTTTTEVGYATGVAGVLVTKGIRTGKYTIEVTGDYFASDPDTVDSDSVNGRVVFTQVAQLKKKPRKAHSR